ncbi:hypothetical protein [Cupriavidus numazuensis]|uniref:Tail fiber protein n=1 Tax=Cupriavidus numazuensis TaxID=221992 RepID=A0ABM8TB56_9BURK|nr:hypothetical protein [Cupriavidus numazuensis]CAG2132468.1 hypothetical protein LMG26411_00623 [Cupriavidus numazuensis]
METDHLILRENVLRTVTVPESEANLKYLEGLAASQAAAAGASATAAGAAKTAAEAARDAANDSKVNAAQSRSDAVASASQAVAARQAAEAARDTASTASAAATSQAGIATAQAAIATTQAGDAAASATAAAGSASAATASTSAIANGTATDGGTLTGSETLPMSRGAGLLQTTLSKIASFVYATLGLTKTVATMVDLQALDAAIWTQVKTQGYRTAGDGGHGTYRKLSGAQTADGGAIIAGANGSYFGLEYVGKVHALQYGAYGDNSHDDQPALQALQAFCKPRRLWMDLSGNFVYRLNSTWALTRPCLLEMGNSILRSNLSSGYAVTYGGGSGQDYTHRTIIRGFRLWGPQVTNSGTYSYWPDITAGTVSQADGIQLDGTAQQVDDALIDGFEVQGFRDNVTLSGANLYLMHFRNVKWGAAWRRGLAFALTSNAGEKISITGGSIFNNINNQFSSVAVYDPGNTGIDLYLHDVSIDYNDIDFVLKTTKVYAFGCHQEGNTANANVQMTYVSGFSWPEFHMYGGYLGTGPGASPFGNTESASGKTAWINIATGAGGHYRVTMDGVALQMKGSSALINPVDGVAGNESLRGLAMTFSNAVPPAINYGTSQVCNGRFQQLGGNLNAFTLAPDANGAYTYDSSVTVGNSRSMKFVSAVASTSKATQDLPYKGGDSILIRSRIRIDTITAGSTRCVLYFYAADGTTLISSIIVVNSVSGTQAALTAVTSGFATLGGVYLAPAGTGRVVFSWEQTGMVGTCWLAGVDSWKV